MSHKKTFLIESKMITVEIIEDGGDWSDRPCLLIAENTPAISVEYLDGNEISVDSARWSNSVSLDEMLSEDEIDELYEQIECWLQDIKEDRP